ncbi:MAG: hypothetical protein A2Z36_01495 [Chloroflexi bacterium RBG_19FT_COMBO_48_23]|nr:MAG: hypothetical protein A2Z36_01495 [Chloroflexi bacterium RBG_19FT_COMBO_48_23]
MPAKSSYTDSLKDCLRLEPTIESDVVRELNTHLEDKSRELIESGLSEEEASITAANLLGSPRVVARQMYEVYNQGSWRQALFAALPHLLIAALFALHFWKDTIWLIGIIIAVVCAVIYGWCHGKPAWLFPWLGYCLTPVIAIGTLLIYLPGSWTWFAAIAYIPLALLVIVPVTKKTIRKDWIFASLMLLPIPIVLGWMLALELDDTLIWYKQLQEFASQIALSFAVLALTVATFIRIRQRWAKVGALLTLETLILVIVALGGNSAIGFGGWLLLVLLSLILVLGPALLERKIKTSDQKPLKLHNKSAR